MSATTTVPRLQPPVQDPPIASDGTQHSDAWAGFHQNVADQLTTLPARMRKGVVDGSDATAGQIGEFMTASASGVGLTNNVAANVVSLDLTAGDWDVSGNCQFSAGSGTHVTFAAGIDSLDTQITATFPAGAITQGISTSTRRHNGTSTVTVWLVALASFTGSATASGTIRARRMR